MLLISISLCYVVGLPTLAIDTLSTSTLEWIFSAPISLPSPRRPALPVCRVLLGTATVPPSEDGIAVGQN